jgi:hypothetical protein
LAFGGAATAARTVLDTGSGIGAADKAKISMSFTVSQCIAAWTA